MKKKTISIFKANLFGGVIFVLISLTSLFFFNLRFGLKNKIFFDTNWDIFFFVLLFCISIFIHELIHAFIFAQYAKNGWKSVKIGVLWKKLTPFAHCSESLKRNNYIFAVILPFIVQGLIPIIFSFLTSKIFFLIYGIIMSTAAGGDILIFLMLLRVSKNSTILDHETECGFWIINTKN